MKISIVTTLYLSEPFLEEFINLSLKALSKIQCDSYELVFVNDGSPDQSLEKLLEKKKNNNNIKIIDLSRNFGHHYAMQAGLRYSSGQYVFLIDNDLEVSPLVLERFYNELIDNQKIDAIYGYQEKRKGSFVEKATGHIFWYVINKVSDFHIPQNLLTERIMTRRYVDKILSIKDTNLFLVGMFHWIGFKQKGIPIVKKQRKSKSTYTFKKRTQLMVQAITSFSGKPLVWLFNFGIILSVISAFFIIYLISKKIILGDQIQIGWTSIIATNVFVLGLFSTFLGLVGIYLFKIFNQVQGRPNYIIKDIYE